MDFKQLNMDQRVAAFADGELPPDQCCDVFQHLADHPEVLKRVIAEQKMRQVCGRVIAKTCGCGCPGDLKRRIAELAETHTPPATMSEPVPGTSAGPYEAATDHPGWRMTFSRWTPLAAAAMFFVAALVALNMANRRQSLGDGSIVPVSQVEQFQWRHTRCSRAIDDLAKGDYPARIEALPDAISLTLGRQPYPMLDLTQAGYTFHQAGPCTLPGSRAIHLIYRATPESGRTDSLSLWIEPDINKLPLESGKPYRITGDQAAHPMLVWKHGDMVYYLVGDADDAVDRAVETLNKAG